MKRADMLRVLTERELQWFSNNPNELEMAARFFALGGFAQYSTATLALICKRRSIEM